MNTLDQQIDYLRKQLGIRDSQVLNDLLNSYSNAQISLQNQLVKQQQRIDRAIEYCEEITSREIDISDTDYDLGQDFTARDILDILRGEKDEKV